MLILSSILDLTAAAALKTSLREALAKGDGLAVDASAVSRVTSPCLQVLAAGMRAFTESGGPGLRIVTASDAFRDTVSGLGLAPMLGLQENISG